MNDQHSIVELDNHGNNVMSCLTYRVVVDIVTCATAYMPCVPHHQFKVVVVIDRCAGETGT